MAKKKNILKIVQRNENVFFYLPEAFKINDLDYIIKKYNVNLKFSKSKVNYMVIDFNNYNKTKLFLDKTLSKEEKEEIIKKEKENKKNNGEKITYDDFEVKINNILEFLEIV